MQEKLVVHHIGARGETQAFPSLPAFDADVVNVLVDADKSSTHETQKINDHRKAKVIVEPACIAGANGPRTFRHTHSPYGSSLFPIDPAVGDLYVAPHWVDFDYTIKEALSTSRTEVIETITLDAMVAKSGGKIPLPDFLSLDTQGSELEILDGSPQCVVSALGVVCEVEFVSLYDGQPLLGDIFKFMQSNGFVFCGFSEILNGSYYRAPIGLRGRGIPVTTDALFLKRPDEVIENSDLRLRKLAFIALVNGHTEFALWALSYLPEKLLAEKPWPTWLVFVEEFCSIVEKFPRLYLETFDQQKSSPEPDKVRARFAERGRPDFETLKLQSAALNALLLQYGLNAVAELHAANLTHLITHFGLATQNGAP
jgi:hypothetical protein